jgi:methylmalonyl-CoA mutase cobalamin-binding domain/chain
MTDLSVSQQLTPYKAKHKIRFVTAASLFDGHDAAINIMRRILQGMGAEVSRLGHNRSVDEVITAAQQEDVQGIAVSSYQGGHVEYFKYMVDLLRQRGGAHVQVFGGGGGVIVPAEIRELQEYGVARIYSPEDGQRMGLAGMIGEIVMRCDHDLSPHAPKDAAALLQQLDHVLEILDMPALVRADRDALHVFLQRRGHDLVDRAVVAQVDHLRAHAHQDAADDVDRGVVAVEEAGGGDEAHLVRRAVFGQCPGFGGEVGHGSIGWKESGPRTRPLCDHAIAQAPAAIRRRWRRSPVPGSPVSIRAR